MANINGVLSSPVGGLAGDFPGRSVKVQLSGYGPQIPRASEGLFAPVERIYEVDATGAFTFSLAGNDVITPPGTFYTITVMDDNGDVVQCNAYIFLENLNYDLSDTQPYNPNFPPPALPILLGNQLLTVAYSAAPIFPGDTYPTWKITLAGDVNAATFTGLADGNLYTLMIQQDATGGHRFSAPANLVNFAGANPDPNATTVQTFIAVGAELYAIGPATWWTP